MAIKKSDLYSSLWASCDELRGGMDASQYKDYVLVLLFMKYVSDKAASQPGYLLDVPKGGSFADMVALKGDKEIGDKMNKIVARIAEANDLTIIKEADFNDDAKLGKGQEMVDRLGKLVAIFENLDFAGNRAEGDDLLGDAYEYLMRHFATESGKSKGQFYTPAEVSRIMARVVGVGAAKDSKQTIYDPTCGSGSLMLKAHDEAKARTGHDLALYGQEKDNSTTALAKMNMILHGCTTAAPDIWNGNTLAAPHFKDAKTGKLKTHDFVVANPPFSDKAWTNGMNVGNDEFGRFVYGTPPEKNGDYAYLLHILASMKSTGKGAVILPHGVLFRGGAEGSIRREVVKRGFIKGIIGLPANLFYGTGIPACIIVLDKEEAATRQGIFLIDASKGFIKDGNKNRLRERDLHKIVDVFTNAEEHPGYSRLVPLAEIEKNDFNLNLPRYIDGQEAEDIQDIGGHLQGGIPTRDIDALTEYWRVCPKLRAALFKPNRPGYHDLLVEAARIKETIHGHPQFAAFIAGLEGHFATWRESAAVRLRKLKAGCHPKEIIGELSENLLAHAEGQALIDPYAVYQHLMDYWAATMQDDCYLIAADGWVARTARILEKDKSGKVKDKGWVCDLVPKSFIVARYFAKEQAALEAKRAALESVSAGLVELEEEHGGEEGLLGVMEKVGKAEVTALLKTIQDDKGAKEETAVLRQWLKLNGEEGDLRRAVRDADAALDQMAYTQYPKLTEAEIKVLVVEDKWMAAIGTAVQSELDRVSQTLTGRIRLLAERYAAPLPQIEDEVERLAAKVEKHLKKMGAA
jgi:type I restriction enzyme M protein